MLIIVSNTGNWDHDMWGTVGAIDHGTYRDSVNKFKEFVKNDQLKSCDGVDLSYQGFSEDQLNYVEGHDNVMSSLEENEVSFLCKGKELAVIEYTNEGCFSDLYYLIDLEG